MSTCPPRKILLSTEKREEKNKNKTNFPVVMSRHHLNTVITVITNLETC